MAGLGVNKLFNSLGKPSFAPLSLFSSAEPGVWYDPSDLSTLYQDSAGTTPVTAVEQPVGLMLDKSQGLVLGDELVTNGDFSDGTTGWVGTAADITVNASGQLVVAGNSGVSTNQSARSLGITVVQGRSYRVSARVISTNDSGAVGFIMSGGLFADTGLSYKYFPVASEKYISGVVRATSSTIYINLHAGTIVGALSVFDDASLKELPGNHAYQTTSGSRPTLSARVNLLTKTEDFSDAAWTKSSVTATADLVTITSSGGGIYQVITVSPSTQYLFSVEAKAGTLPTSQFRLAFRDDTAGAFIAADITPSVTINADSYTLVTYEVTTPVGCTSLRVYPHRYTVSGTGTIYLRKADLRVTNDGADIPAYQRVNTSTDYDTEGFPPYLKFDGSDDYMVTNTITPATAADTGRAALVTAGWTITDGGAA